MSFIFSVALTFAATITCAFARAITRALATAIACAFAGAIARSFATAIACAFTLTSGVAAIDLSADFAVGKCIGVHIDVVVAALEPGDIILRKGSN